ncbi:NTP transferase domain-containing protein [Prochlorococcus marinus XMU1412]|uniref:NTP transferase domain-containing protein n=1 Tax=Prochlorococcus marinus TaxID=1219 RepID=UPI001ADA42F3|nr:sugar phosphate nucleotidyltransferase [Prochlorococcus marinus]MBO8240543.1 NTP transferase domain-containing protein [Prochlorococcus marinus XMU1412]MBW3071778.1 hypothetical protein [Prochlorococcus marinus str. MU1412]
MKFQLVIPMSGIGLRFINEGYKVPKPLIEVNGKPIINHVFNIFKNIESVVFICNEDHLADKKLNMMMTLKEIHPNSNVVSIKPHKKGPVFAVLQALDFINPKMPTIVNYCDFFCLFNEKSFIEMIKKENPDGCIFTYTGFHPHMISSTNYAYVSKLKNSVKDIQEKKPFTNEPMNEEASSGSYYFKSGLIMKNYFKKTLASNLEIKGEYYVSMVYKIMLNEGKKVNTFLIDHFMQWGTPSDLKEYLWYSDLFKSLINNQNSFRPYQIGTILMPMAGEGKRFKIKGFTLPKPLIEVSGKNMFQQALNDLPVMDSYHLVIKNNQLSNFRNLELIKENKKNNINLLVLDKPTKGQADTCLQAIENLSLNTPLTISACDMGIIFDYKNFKNLMDNDNVDIIVWGCRGYPGAIKNPQMYGWIIEEKNIIKKIIVKKNTKNPQDDPCVIGTFTFKKPEFFSKAAQILIEKKHTVNNEYYVDSCINEAIGLGLNVVFMEVQFFLCWGTPNDLHTYKYWQECFNKWNDHPYKKILDNDFNNILT